MRGMLIDNHHTRCSLCDDVVFVNLTARGSQGEIRGFLFGCCLRFGLGFDPSPHTGGFRKPGFRGLRLIRRTAR